MEDEFINMVPKDVFEQDFKLYFDIEREQVDELVAGGVMTDEKIRSDWRKLVQLASEVPGALGMFAEKLEEKYRHIGRLHCVKQTKQESDQDWHVLCSCNIYEKSVSVKRLLNGAPGEFLFVPLFDPMIATLLDKLPTDTKFRFFAYFGGMRETAPHFGGNYFLKTPGELFHEAIRSRTHFQKEWLGCEVFHTGGNCNYMVIGQSGKIGFVPLNGDRRIGEYAETFDEAIMRWVEDL